MLQQLGNKKKCFKVKFGKTGESSNGSGTSNSALPLDIQGDSPNVQITTVKLDGTNTLEWSQSAKMYIGRQGKLGYINSREIEPSESDTLAYDK